jgi:hypothetical protein
MVTFDSTIAGMFGLGEREEYVGVYAELMLLHVTGHRLPVCLAWVHPDKAHRRVRAHLLFEFV